MTDFKIVFIHGYTASHLADWYPNISRQLDKLGVDYTIPDLPGGMHPRVQNWLDVLHNVISQNEKPLVLMGHSLGTRTALLYIEKYRPKIKNVFLIAAFANSIKNADRNDGEAYPDFFEYKIDLERIKPLVGKFIVMHSQDDSSIPYEQAVSIAKDLSGQLITYEGRDHFSDPENAPFILEVLREELSF